MRWLGFCLVAAGCGRLGYEAVPAADAARADATMDAGATGRRR